LDYEKITSLLVTLNFIITILLFLSSIILGILSTTQISQASTLILASTFTLSPTLLLQGIFMLLFGSYVNVEFLINTTIFILYVVRIFPSINKKKISKRKVIELTVYACISLLIITNWWIAVMMAILTSLTWIVHVNVSEFREKKIVARIIPGR